MSIDAYGAAALAALLAAIRGKSTQDGIKEALGELTPSIEYARQVSSSPLWNILPFIAGTSPKKILDATAQRRRILIYNLSQSVITIAPGMGLLPATGFRISPAQYGFSGQPIAVTQGGPGAGADWSFTVPATSIGWRIRGVGAQLTTSAAAGNRIPDLQTEIPWQTNPTLTIATRLVGTQPVAPGAQMFYYWLPNAPNATHAIAGNQQANQMLPPDLVIPAGGKLLSVTENLAGGDAWGTLVIWKEELVQTGAGGVFDDSGSALHGGDWWAYAPASAAGLVAELRG